MDMQEYIDQEVLSGNKEITIPLGMKYDKTQSLLLPPNIKVILQEPITLEREYDF